ncbi:hypothetical protein [Escherichia phage vB_EcoP_LHP]
MIKSKRKLNKQALINKRLYTVVGNSAPHVSEGCVAAGNISHAYPAGTVLERDDSTYDRSDESYVYGAVHERDRAKYADSQWLNTVQVI